MNERVRIEQALVDRMCLRNGWGAEDAPEAQVQVTWFLEQPEVALVSANQTLPNFHHMMIHESITWVRENMVRVAPRNPEATGVRDGA